MSSSNESHDMNMRLTDMQTVPTHAAVVRDARISCAMQGLLRPGEYLAPSDWEEVRLRLQNIYRAVTGEQHAVISVEPTP